MQLSTGAVALWCLSIGGASGKHDGGEKEIKRTQSFCGVDAFSMMASFRLHVIRIDSRFPIQLLAYSIHLI
jgi:hypothetical protein